MKIGELYSIIVKYEKRVQRAFEDYGRACGTSKEEFYHDVYDKCLKAYENLLNAEVEELEKQN